GVGTASHPPARPRNCRPASDGIVAFFLAVLLAADVLAGFAAGRFVLLAGTNRPASLGSDRRGRVEIAQASGRKRVRLVSAGGLPMKALCALSLAATLACATGSSSNAGGSGGSGNGGAQSCSSPMIPAVARRGSPVYDRP